MTGVTRDGFLDGRLTILQPEKGYRAGADPVFLAAAVQARPGESVIELGCGVGTALCCLMARVPELDCVGVELQPALADLARENLSDNGFAARIVTADIARLPPDLRASSFDHVMLNPPWFSRRESVPAADAGREQGRGGDAALDVWLDVALRRLAPKGRLAMILRPERLGEALNGLAPRAGDIRLTPLAPRASRDAELVILTARKGAKGALTLAAPLVLHDGQRHDGDRDSYSERARAVLRQGKALSAPD